MTNLGTKIYLNALLSEISACPDLPSVEYGQEKTLERAEFLAAGGLAIRSFGGPCRSIFEFLNVEKKVEPSWYLPPVATTIDKSAFPVKIAYEPPSKPLPWSNQRRV